MEIENDQLKAELEAKDAELAQLKVRITSHLWMNKAVHSTKCFFVGQVIYVHVSTGPYWSGHPFLLLYGDCPYKSQACLYQPVNKVATQHRVMPADQHGSRNCLQSRERSPVISRVWQPCRSSSSTHQLGLPHTHML